MNGVLVDVLYYIFIALTHLSFMSKDRCLFLYRQQQPTEIWMAALRDFPRAIGTAENSACVSVAVLTAWHRQRYHMEHSSCERCLQALKDEMPPPHEGSE